MDVLPPDSRRGRFDKEQTRQAILDAACEEFSERGLAGARVEAIASRTKTVKRMIYYYFGSKQGLYRAVLEQAYAGIRQAETELDLEGLEPGDALRRLVTVTFDYHDANPGFSRLISIENIHRAAQMAQSEQIRALNSPVIEAIGAILVRGRRDCTFRADLDAVDVHLLISSFCFFRVANRHTFGMLFGRDLSSRALRERHRDMIADAVLCALRPGRDGAGGGGRDNE